MTRLGTLRKKKSLGHLRVKLATSPQVLREARVDRRKTKCHVVRERSRFERSNVARFFLHRYIYFTGKSINFIFEYDACQVEQLKDYLQKTKTKCVIKFSPKLLESRKNLATPKCE